MYLSYLFLSNIFFGHDYLKLLKSFYINTLIWFMRMWQLSFPPSLLSGMLIFFKVAISQFNIFIIQPLLQLEVAIWHEYGDFWKIWTADIVMPPFHCVILLLPTWYTDVLTEGLTITLKLKENHRNIVVMASTFYGLWLLLSVLMWLNRYTIYFFLLLLHAVKYIS